jgi:hypothetical protein
MPNSATQAQALAVAAVLMFATPAAAQNSAPVANTQLNTLKDIQIALRKCWVWPSVLDSSGNMDLTVMLSFRRNGELFGGRITHVNRDISDNERALYYSALQKMIGRCSHLPISESLGEAIAGRPFMLRIHDTRKEKRA